MTLEDLQRQKNLLEQKQIELNKISLNQRHSQMNLRSGRNAQLQRQQDKGFCDIVKGQKADTSKKIVSISQLITQQETYPDDQIFSSSSVQDFSILSSPKHKKIKKRSRMQQNMGWLLE